MSEEGANLPHEVKQSHDRNTAANSGSTPAIVALAIMRSTNSNSSSISKLASEANNDVSKLANLVVLHAGDEENTVGSKISSSKVVHASENNNAGSKISSPAVLHAAKVKDKNDGSKLVSSVVLHAGEENKARFKTVEAHAGKDNNSRSKLTMSPGLHANEGDNVVSKLSIQAMPHASEDSNTGSSLAMLHGTKGTKSVPKLSIQVEAHAGKDNFNARSKLAKPVVLNAGEEKNTKSMLTEPAMLYANKGKISMYMLTVQTVPYADENNNVGSKLATMAGLGKDINTASKLATKVVPHVNIKSKISKLFEDSNVVSKLSISAVPYVNEDNNTGSKLARMAVLHANKDNNTAPKLTIQVVPHASKHNNDKEGKKKVAGEDNNKNVSGASSGGDSSSNTFTKSTSDDGSTGAHNTIKDAPIAVAHGDRGGEKGEDDMAVEDDMVVETEDDMAVETEDDMAVEIEDELHIWTEREQRKKMKNLYNTLIGLLPQLPQKADKATIVGKTLTYIRALEGTVQRLEEKLKLQRMRQAQAEQQPVVVAGSSSAAPATREAALADTVQGWNKQEALVDKLKAAATAYVPAPAMQTWSAPNAVVSVADLEAFINLRTPRRPHMLSCLLEVLERHRIDVVSATVSSDQRHNLISMQARINGPAPVLIQEKLMIEDRFKRAVAEMMHVVAN